MRDSRFSSALAYWLIDSLIRELSEAVKFNCNEARWEKVWHVRF